MRRASVLVTLFLFLCGIASATIARVAETATSAGTCGGTAPTCTFSPTSYGASHFVAIAVAYGNYNATQTVTMNADSLGLTITAACTVNSFQDGASVYNYVYIWYIQNTGAGGSDTLSITFSGAAYPSQGLVFAAAEYSGIATTGSIQDGSCKKGTGSSGNLASGSLTTTGSSDLLFAVGAVFSSASAITAGSGFTLVANTNNIADNVAFEDAINQSASGYNAQMTPGTNSGWAISFAAFSSTSSSYGTIVQGSTIMQKSAIVQQ